MAITINSTITPNNPNGFVIAAKHVAVTDGESTVTLQSKIESLVAAAGSGGSGGGTANTIQYSDTKTIKQKIDELEASLPTSASQISYSYTTTTGEGEEAVTSTVNTTVKAILDSLRASLGGVADISEKVTQAQQSAAAAANSASVAQAMNTAMASSITNATTEFNNIKDDTIDYVDTVKDKIDNINDIANQLNTVFSASGKFAIMTEDAYAAAKAVGTDVTGGIYSNTIYFIYKPYSS